MDEIRAIALAGCFCVLMVIVSSLASYIVYRAPGPNLTNISLPLNISG